MAGTVGRVQDLIVEHGKVQRQTKSERERKEKGERGGGVMRKREREV